jgi:hypothetical protein
MHSFKRLGLAALIAVGTTMAAAPAQAQPANPDRAAELFRQGNEAYKKKKWDDAYKLFKEAFEAKQSYDVAGNLGDVELMLGKQRDAAEHLAWSLRHWPAGQSEARARTEQRLTEAKKSVAQLTIKVTSDGAEISVNGNVVGTSPLEGAVFVEAGAINVEVKSGDKSMKKTVALDKGEEREVVVEIAPGSDASAGAAGGAGATSTDAQPPQPKGDTGPVDDHPQHKSSLKKIGLITSGAVAAVGLGVGVGFLLAKNSASNKASSLDSDNHLGTTGCSANPQPAACSDLADANNSAKRDATISTIGFIGAGVGVAGLVAFLLMPDSKPTTATIHPLLGQHTVGLGAYGQF